jgi:hypothetical protein
VLSGTIAGRIVVVSRRSLAIVGCSLPSLRKQL